MMKIFDLLNCKTKKQLLAYLKNELIPYSISKNHEGQKYVLFSIAEEETLFYIETCIDKEEIVYYRIQSEEENQTNQEVVELTFKLKEKIQTELGNPIKDNTNHLLENRILISYQKENWDIDLSCRDYDNTEGKYYLTILFINSLKATLTPQPKKLNFWYLYMLGGFVFALLMFVSMGKYTWMNFGICFLGGILWGLLFGFLMNIFSPKDIFQMKKQSKKFKANLSKVSNRKLFEGMVYYETSTKWSGKFVKAAAVEIKNKEAILYFMDKKKMVNIHVSLETICKDIYFEHSLFYFKTDERTYSFLLSKEESINQLITFVDQQFFTNEEFMPLFLKLKEATKKFNPYRLYEIKGDTCLDNKIAIIAKLLTIGRRITPSYLEKIMMQVFENDDYYCLQLSTVYWDIYSQIK